MNTSARTIQEIAHDTLGTFRGARAYQAIHCWAWNPDPRREKAIRDDAMASRMMLAMQIGAEVPTHATNDK